MTYIKNNKVNTNLFEDIPNTVSILERRRVSPIQRINSTVFLYIPIQIQK